MLPLNWNYLISDRLLRKVRGRRRRGNVRQLEQLEVRCLLTQFVVTSNADSGSGTLRDAIDLANSNPDADEITFALTPGNHTIALTNPLPSINNPVSIDANGTLNTPQVELDGSDIDRGIHPYPNGLAVYASDTTIEGFAIGGFHTGITIHDFAGGANNTVRQNHLGTDSTGLLARGNSGNGIDLTSDFNVIEENVISANGSNGIWITDGGGHSNTIHNNLIGVASDGATGLGNAFSGVHVSVGVNNVLSGNTISANVRGVVLHGASNTGNTIHSNRIGTDVFGTVDIGNSEFGVWLFDGPSSNVISANVISGNDSHGVLLLGEATDGNELYDNLIGTDATGTADLGNGQNGVLIAQGADNNTIGQPGQGNTLSGNGWSGVQIQRQGSATTGNVVDSNVIGTTANGLSALGNIGNGIDLAADGNTVRSNIISGNGANGIWLTSEGASNNEVSDNLIGLTATGNTALGNAAAGLSISIGSGNVISSNTISGNSTHGVVLGTGTFDNWLWGNNVGTNSGGGAAIANGQDGVLVASGAYQNLIGTNGDGIEDTSERNIVSGNSWHGIDIWGTSNVVAGNYVGLASNGLTAIGNGRNGIAGGTLASSNRIGTNGDGISDVEERNVISGNHQNGILIYSLSPTQFPSGNIIAGNYIGTDTTGTIGVGNVGRGISLQSTAGTRVGTDGDGQGDGSEGNVVADNGLGGIELVNSRDSVIAGNIVGAAADGLTPLGNRTSGYGAQWGYGIWLQNGSNNNRIGTNGDGVSDAVETNRVWFNETEGVRLTGSGTVRNEVRGNSIAANGQQAIDLGDDGPDVVDSLDVDSGPNEKQNYPVLSQATANAGIVVSGQLNSSPSTTFTLDFYASATTGAAERYLGSGTVTTGTAGNAAFSVTLATTASDGELITATATDPVGNTSELSVVIPFSANVDPGLVFDDPADDGIRSVREGDTLTVSGTWSDANGDSVTLSASAGTVSGNGTGFGTWVWSWTPGDGPDESQTVTITADDGIGGTDSVEVHVTVNNETPTIGLSGAGSVLQGGVYTLTLGEVTDPGQDTVTEFIVDWGDGFVETFQQSGDVTHVYTTGAVNPGSNEVSTVAVADTFLTDFGGHATWHPNSSHPDDISLWAINEFTPGGGGSLAARPMFQFDLSAQAGTTAEGDAVFRAFVNGPASNSSYYHGDPRRVDLYQVTQAWDDDTATWNTRPPISYFSSQHIVHVGNQEWVEWTIPQTTLQNWLDDPSDFHGLALVNELPDSFFYDLVFSSIENPDGNGAEVNFNTSPDSFCITVDLVDEDGTWPQEDCVEVIVINDRPVAVPRSLGSIPEGGSGTLSGADSTDAGNNIVSYEWDLDNDGIFETSGVTVTFDASSLDGPTTATAVLRVTDAQGLVSDPVPLPIEIENVAPTLTIDLPIEPAFEGQQVAVTGTFSDVPSDVVEINARVQGDANVYSVAVSPVDGTWEWAYTPPDDTGGPFEVTLTASDEDGDSSPPLTFSLVVENDPPDAVDDSDGIDLVFAEDELGRVLNLLANDSDPAGALDPLTIISVNDSGTSGSVTLSNGEVTYSPNGQFESLREGVAAIDSFTYTISDGDGGADTATAFITVEGRNDAPVAIGSLPNLSVPAGSPPTVIDLANIGSYFTDVDLGDTLTLSASSSGAPVTASYNSTTGLLTLTYTSGVSGTSTVTVTATDGSGETAQIAFSVTATIATPGEQIGVIRVLIDELTEQGELNGGQANSLHAKLNAAEKSINKGKTKTALNQLNALRQSVESFVEDGVLSPESGDALLFQIDLLVNLL